MFYSLLVKLAMLVATMGVVFWIGWTVPEIGYLDVDRGPRSAGNDVNPALSVGATGGSAPTVVSPLDRSPASPSAPRPTVVGHLDLNRATERDLEALPGIGPVLAQRIVQYRRSQGAFHEVGQLREVKGIGKKTFDRIRPLVGVTPPSGLTPGGRKAT